jgi:hypothetical protein
LEAVERAGTIAAKTGNVAQLVEQRIGIWAALNAAGDFSVSIAVADQMLDLARRDGSDKSLGWLTTPNW